MREYKTRVPIWILFGQIETKYTQWKDNTSKASDNYLSFRDYAIFSRRLKFTSSFHNAVSSSLWNFDYIVFENVKGMTTIDQICKAFGLWARASYTWPWFGLSITFPILLQHHATTGLEDGLIHYDKRHPPQIIHDMEDVSPRKLIWWQGPDIIKRGTAELDEVWQMSENESVTGLKIIQHWTSGKPSVTDASDWQVDTELTRWCNSDHSVGGTKHYQHGSTLDGKNKVLPSQYHRPAGIKYYGQSRSGRR